MKNEFQTTGSSISVTHDLQRILCSQTKQKVPTFSNMYRFKFCRAGAKIQLSSMFQFNKIPRKQSLRSFCKNVFRQKKRQLSFSKIVFFIQIRIRQRVIFPGGHPPSIVTAISLYFRVRDGNEWFPDALSPEICFLGLRFFPI